MGRPAARDEAGRLMPTIDVGGLTWTVARAGGFVAYGLLTASVALGLVLSLRWRSTSWPRYVSNETHRFLTVVALWLTLVHTLAVALDPFIGFSPVEVTVPLAAHYRPLWVGLGILAAYVTGAVWASEYVRPRIGYAWWRRFHTLAFVGWGLATLHGLGTGSDTGTWWAIAVYGSSALLVLGLILARLLPAEPARRRPLLAAIGVQALVLTAIWSYAGPLRGGWNEIANDGNGAGNLSAGIGDVNAPILGAFESEFAGTVSESPTGNTLTLEAQLDGGDGVDGHLRIDLEATPGAGAAKATGTVELDTSDGASCQGDVVSVSRGMVVASCVEAGGTTWTLRASVSVSADGRAGGELTLGTGTDLQSVRGDADDIRAG